MSKRLTILKTIIMEKKFFYLSLILAAIMTVGLSSCKNKRERQAQQEVAQELPKEQEVTVTEPENKTLTGTVKRCSIILDEHIFVMEEFPGLEFKVFYKRCPEATYLQVGDVVTVTFPVISGRFRLVEKLDIKDFNI